MIEPKSTNFIKIVLPLMILHKNMSTWQQSTSSPERKQTRRSSMGNPWRWLDTSKAFSTWKCIETQMNQPANLLIYLNFLSAQSWFAENSRKLAMYTSTSSLERWCQWFTRKNKENMLLLCHLDCCWLGAVGLQWWKEVEPGWKQWLHVNLDWKSRKSFENSGNKS